MLSICQCTRRRQNSINEELARQERATLYRKPYRNRKQPCSTLQGLFDTLPKKFRPQFNETTKLLQFRKLYRFKGKSIEEWIGRLCMAVAECNYKEIDWQLKEQFIHGLNDKTMLEIIRELTARNNDEQTASKGVLMWAKRIEAQWVQAATMNDITKLHQFNKINMASKMKGGQARQAVNATLNRWPCRYCGRIHAPQQCLPYGKMCTRCGKTGHYKKVCRSKRDHAVHELQVEMVQDSQDEEIETVSINSIYLNKNRSLITAHLEMQVGKNTVEIP